MQYWGARSESDRSRKPSQSLSCPSHTSVSARASVEHSMDNPDADLLQICVTTANEIAKFLQIGDGGSPVVEQLPDEILERFGTNFQGLIGDLPGLDAEIEKAQVFVKL